MHCVNEEIIKISPFWTLLFQNLNDCLVFPFIVFAIYGNILLLKYSGYFVWDIHTLLDRGNLCHSDEWYILCCLLRVFASTVTWDFCTALLVPCNSKLVCHFYSHFCLVLVIVHCAFFVVVIFCLFSMFLACPPFLQLVLVLASRYLFVFSQVLTKLELSHLTAT